MKSKMLKAISIAQVFVLLMGLCVLSAPVKTYAAGLGVETSAAYQGSVYYQRACEAYNNNPDPRTRLVQVALSQKGYKGGTSSGQWAGNGAGGRYTEYGRFMGADGYDWCASFVSWCAAAAGIPKSVIPRSTYAKHWATVSTGTYTPMWSNNFTTYNSSYKPQVGDFCLYMPYCKTCNLHYNASTPSAHVVIVAGVGSTQNADGSWSITTIERAGNTVDSKKITTKTSRGAGATCKCGKQTPAGTYAHVVQGFWRPDWSKLSSGVPEGVTPSTPVKANVALTAATQADYVAKEFVGETNACVVTQITKPAGTLVTQCGLVLMDAKGTVLKNYSENISNVGKNTTLFHSWYDINAELNYTLSKGTTYQYKFFTVVDGVRYEGATRSFTTGGETYYNLYFDTNGGSCSTGSKKIKQNSVYGELPTAVRDGYTFAGWYTRKNGGVQVTANSYFAGNADMTIYAMWTKNAVETCTIGYDAYGGTGTMNSASYTYGDSVTVENCRFTNSGKEFYTWVLFRESDMTYLTTNNGWQTVSALQTYGYKLKAYDPGTKVVVDEAWASDISEKQTFYFVAIWQDVETENEKNADEVSVRLYINSPTMLVNGKSVSIDNQGTAPRIINDRTMIPIRALIEALGGTVGWNGTLQQVTLTLDGKTLYLRIGENYAFDRNNTYALDSAPVLANGRTLLPVRAVVEYFGGSVSWNSAAKCVTIHYQK